MYRNLLEPNMTRHVDTEMTVRKEDVYVQSPRSRSRRLSLHLATRGSTRMRQEVEG